MLQILAEDFERLGILNNSITFAKYFQIFNFWHKMDKNYILIPNISLGIFKFGNNIEKYIHQFDYEYSQVEPESDYYVYEFENPNIDVYVEEGLVESISCRKKCIYKGKNIIGMKIQEFINLSNAFPDLNLTDTAYTDEENKNIDNPQIIYEFENLGLQTWVKNSIIISVFCSPPEIEEEILVPSRDIRNQK